MRTVFLHGVGALLVGGALVAGCGSDDGTSGGSSGGDTSSGGDSSSGGKSSAGGQGGAKATGGKDGSGGHAGEGGATGAGPDLVKTYLVPGGSNLYGLTYSADGELYVSGTADDEGDQAIALWRFDAEGNLDESFGEGGVVLHNMGPGNESSYGVLALANGDLVVQGTANGRVFLMKFDSDGELLTEPTFVEFGWLEADLDAMTTPPFADWPIDAPPAYTSWGIALDGTGADEKIVVFAHGAPRKGDLDGSTQQRTDNDRWVARLLASDFSPDAAFNGGQALGVDVDGAGMPDNTRRGFVEDDGKILSAGYTDFGEGNHVALMRLTASGQLDASFGFGTDTDQDGLTRFQPFSGTGAMSEAYSAVKAGARYITSGYGVSNFLVPTNENDVVSFGVLADGLDPDYGDDGAFAIQSEEDPTPTWDGGRQHRDNGRDLVVLPDQRTLHVGCYNDYAAVFMVQEDGGLDESFGDYGMLVLDASSDYTAHERPFFKAALSPDGSRVAASSQGGLLAIFELAQD